MLRAYSVDFWWQIVWLSVVNHWDANDILTTAVYPSEQSTLWPYFNKLVISSPSLIAMDLPRLCTAAIIEEAHPVLSGYIPAWDPDKAYSNTGSCDHPSNNPLHTKIYGMHYTGSAAYYASTRWRAESKIHGWVSMYDPSVLLWIDESGCDSMCKRAESPEEIIGSYVMEFSTLPLLSCLWRVFMTSV